jgi:taurine dioxygenase
MMNGVSDGIEIVPMVGALGAEIRGPDLSRPVNSDMVAVIKQAWYQYQVILFRDQYLTDDDLVAFCRCFGELHLAPHHEYGKNAEGLAPEVELISNVLRDGRPIGALGAGEAAWHTDMSMFEEPASATMLYAEEIPRAGGNTRFTNLYAAYEALPRTVRAAIEGRRSIHDISYTAANEVRIGYQAVTDKTKMPGAQHPIVRTHPATGRKSLYLGREGYGYILGLPVEESDRLLADLWRHMTRPEFVWEHEWRVGDVLIWDNRCTAHMRPAFDARERRIMRRVTAKGEQPA